MPSGLFIQACLMALKPMRSNRILQLIPAIHVSQAICQEIIRSYRRQLTVPEDDCPPQIKRVVETIHRDLFRKPIGIYELKVQCNFGSKGYSGKFKYYVGRTPKDYILHHQCELAKQLLSDPRLSEFNCLEVGIAIGFQSLSSFSMAFKSRTGYSPSEWRSRNLEG